jgi:hypothetical protein
MRWIEAVEDAVEDPAEHAVDEVYIDTVEDTVDEGEEGAKRISTTQQRCQGHSSAMTLPNQKNR